MEKLNYGTAYTAFSREYLNRHPKKKLRKKEEKRLTNFVKKNMCSKFDYLDLIKGNRFFL